MATLRKDGRWQSKKGKIYGYGRTPEEADADVASKLEPSLNRIETASPRTLHEFANRYWLPRIETLESTSQSRYVGCWKKNFGPLAKLPLDEIGYLDVLNWVTNLKGEPNTQLFTISVLKQLLRLAEGLGFPLKPIPWKMIPMPQRPAKRRRVISPDEAAKLLDAVEGTELSAPVFLACVLGMRRAEIAALQWKDLDRQRGELHVRRQRRTEKGSTPDRMPKGGKARLLRLTPGLIDEIDRRGNLDSEYICTRKGERWVPQTILEDWKLIRAKVGMGTWVFHDLRHGAAGLIYFATRDIYAVAAILGHSSTDTSWVYTDMKEETARDALERVQGMVLGGHPSALTPDSRVSKA